MPTALKLTSTELFRMSHLLVDEIDQYRDNSHTDDAFQQYIDESWNLHKRLMKAYVEAEQNQQSQLSITSTELFRLRQLVLMEIKQDKENLASNDGLEQCIPENMELCRRLTTAYLETQQNQISIAISPNTQDRKVKQQ